MNTKSRSNSLENLIVSYIENHGSITIEKYISLCLNHPLYGYYCKTNPIGKNQDFITAPEISQLLGEMLGFWVISEWQKLKRPTQINLIELGPGKGTLMLDILNLIKKVPNLLPCFNIYLIEINKVLKNHQYLKLLPLIENKIKISWLNHISEFNNFATNDIPTLIVANEFLDALPLKQFQYKHNHWHEVVIKLNQDNNLSTFSLALNKSSTNLEKYLPCSFIPKENMVFEYSPLTLDYLSQVINLLNNTRGSALFIDYGYLNNPYTNTIQSIKNHTPANFLHDLGNVDITYLVNFPLLLKLLKEKNITHNIYTQKKFLTRLGVYLRAKQLLNIAKPHQKNNIILGANRILSPTQMGELFKVLEISVY